MLACAVGLYALGLLLGMPLLRALAGCAVGALVVAVVPILGRLRPAVTRAVHPDRVQRGAPAVAELVVGNDSAVRQPAFLALDVVGGEVREVPVRALPAGGSARYRYDLPTGKRGRIAVGPLSVERSDLLGLARARGDIGQVAELWVYPRRHPVRLSPAGRSRHHHEGESLPIPVRGSMDLRSLRDYVVGDELRHLHWKATARTGQLMVREYVDPAQPWCVVLLDTRSRMLTPAAFEEAVEIAASILWESCEQDRPSRLCTTAGLRLDTGGGASGARRLLDELCQVVQDDTADVALDVARMSGRRGDGWFAYVGGADPADVRLAARRFGQSVLFDLSATDVRREHDGTLVVRAGDAATALRTWNAAGAR
ncbi:DUF58 domain-containing protein [Pseudonocardia sp. GCM10023141]|uniref:DUF58 domain-containing protein n=1 Tax=Pseudonocardia sp. GCM10023141 TaxID=3252653 RepID=UPI00360EA66C